MESFNQMEFCFFWNQPGSTCECEICLGPWIETRIGYWRHAFDPLLFSHIRPIRNVIEFEAEEPEVFVREDSPVSSISDQYSTDETFSPPSIITSTDSISDSTASSDGILAPESQVIVISDSDSESLVLSTESTISDEDNLFNSSFTPSDMDEAWELVYGPPAVDKMSSESANEHDRMTGFAYSDNTGSLVDWGNQVAPPNTPDPIYYYRDPESPKDEPPKKIPRYSH